jgi:DNA polymerase-3 subunit epsilon
METSSTNAEWCILNLETTGLFPSGHDWVVEIVLVLADHEGNLVTEWHSLVNPNRDLGPTSIHGITADLANEAPSFSELIGDILQLVNGRRLVAHNAGFDQRFLEAEFERAGVNPGQLDALCTMQIASGLGTGR